MTVTPQRRAKHITIMPVEELLVHLPDLIKIGEVRRGLWVYLWACGETRVEESKLELIYKAVMANMIECNLVSFGMKQLY